MNAYDYRGKTALVTGASSGIGRVFAAELAARGVARLILVARREGVLRQVGEDLAAKFGTQVDVIAADLAVPAACQRVADQVAATGAGVDVLVNNAGFATHGQLDSHADRAVLAEEVQLNCAALAGLTAMFLPPMRERGTGVVINVASTAAFQPLPHMAVYGATKAFVLSFSEALWGENRDSGVRVLALCPGATDTAFFDRVGAQEASVGRREPPEAVVARALHGVDRGQPTVISGTANWAMAASLRLLPRRQIIAVAERAMRPRHREPASA